MDSNLLSEAIIFVCVLIKHLQLQLLPRRLMDHKLHTDREEEDLF